MLEVSTYIETENRDQIRRDTETVHFGYDQIAFKESIGARLAST